MTRAQARTIRRNWMAMYRGCTENPLCPAETPRSLEMKKITECGMRLLVSAICLPTCFLMNPPFAQKARAQEARAHNPGATPSLTVPHRTSALLSDESFRYTIG